MEKTFKNTLTLRSIMVLDPKTGKTSRKLIAEVKR
jgi:hypothetical protein